MEKDGRNKKVRMETETWSRTLLIPMSSNSPPGNHGKTILQTSYLTIGPHGRTGFICVLGGTSRVTDMTTV